MDGAMGARAGMSAAAQIGRQSVGLQHRIRRGGLIIVAAARAQVCRPRMSVRVCVLLLQLQARMGQCGQVRVGPRGRHAVLGTVVLAPSGRHRRREQVRGVGHADRRGMVTGLQLARATITLATGPIGGGALAARQRVHASDTEQRADVTCTLRQRRHARCKRDGRTATDGARTARGASSRAPHGRRRRSRHAATALQRWMTGATRACWRAKQRLVATVALLRLIIAAIRHIIANPILGTARTGLLRLLLRLLELPLVVRRRTRRNRRRWRHVCKCWFEIPLECGQNELIAPVEFGGRGEAAAHGQRLGRGQWASRHG